MRCHEGRPRSQRRLDASRFGLLQNLPRARNVADFTPRLGHDRPRHKVRLHICLHGNDEARRLGDRTLSFQLK